MDEYLRLKSQLDSYLNKPDVKIKENIISVYDLYQILKEKFNELRDVISGETIVETINNNSKDKNFFKKNNRKYCETANGSLDDQKVRIVLQLKENKKDKHVQECLYICKDLDCDEMYFGSCIVDRNFVMENYDVLDQSLEILKEFAKLLSNSNNTNYRGITTQDISDGFFVITLSYDTSGDVEIELEISKEQDPNYIIRRQWLRRQSLSDYIDENKEALYKKIPVDINVLNEFTKETVNNYLNKLNAPILVKKSN